MPREPTPEELEQLEARAAEEADREAEREAEEDARKELEQLYAQQPKRPVPVQAAPEAEPAQPTPEPAPQEPVSRTAAVVRGFGQGLTSNFGDNPMAWLASKLPELDTTPADTLAQWGDIFEGRIPREAGKPGSYEEKLAEQREREKATADQRPGYYLGGGVLGAVTQAASPVGRATFLGRPGAGAAIASGALAGAGASDASGLGEMAQAAESGGMLGLAANRFGAAAGKAVPSAARWLMNKTREWGGSQALKATGYLGKDLKALFKRDRTAAARMGDELLNEPGLVQATDNVADISQRLPALKEAEWARAADVLKQADEARIPFYWESAVHRLREEITEPMAGNPALRQLKDELDTLFSEYEKEAASNTAKGIPNTFERAHRLISDLGKFRTKWGNDWNDRSAQAELEKLRRKVYGVVSDELRSQLRNVPLRDSAYEAFDNAMGRYGTFADAQRAALEGEARGVGGATIGLRDLLAGSVAGGLSEVTGLPSWVVGPAGVLGAKVVRERGSSTLAAGYRNISGSRMLTYMAQRNPEALGKWGSAFAQAAARGPESVTMLDFTLSQTDPEWREHKRALAEQGQQEVEP